MKTYKMFLMALAVLFATSIARAEENVTVTSTGTDISDNLDLKAIATLFGEVADIETFERELNSEERHINNLDLNGDGQVDYLRVVEVKEGNNHLIIIQAVLAKDIFQDVANILVEKTGDNVSVQVIGDEYVYGPNYVIEPVYIYRPVIYDWFWGPYWTCWSSPWYWGYWPTYWHSYACWGCGVYVEHIHVYHYNHHCCSYRYAAAPRSSAAVMRDSRSRHDYADAHSATSFANRNVGVSNARELSSTRRSAAAGVVTGRASVGGTTASSRGAATDMSRRTYGSTNVRTHAAPSGAGTSSRSVATTSTRSAASTSTSRSATSYTPAGRSATTTTASRGNITSSSRSNSYSPATSTRSANNYTSSTASRSSYTPSSTSRSSYSPSSTSRSSSSYGGSSRSSYSGSSYSGGSRSAGGYSGGHSGYSGSGSRAAGASRR